MSINDLGPVVEKLHEEFEHDVEYRAECLYNDITAQILDCMRERDISRAELANRMGVSEARVSRMFSETQNFTLATLAKMACALGLEMEVTVKSDTGQPHGPVSDPAGPPWTSAKTCAEQEPGAETNSNGAS